VIGKEFGIKRACQNCGAKFFDLRKKVPICPKCGTEFVAVKTRTRKTVSKQEKEVAVVPDTPADDKTDSEDEVLDEIGAELEVEVDDDEEDNLIEDTSDIGDDEDDMAGIIDIKTEDQEV
jgi:uncharacterized protein (TIGR02300 family)